MIQTGVDILQVSYEYYKFTYDLQIVISIFREFQRPLQKHVNNYY